MLTEHHRLWGHRMVAVTFLDLLKAHGTLTQPQPARAYYDASKAERDAGATKKKGKADSSPPPASVFGLPLFKLSPLELRFIAAGASPIKTFLLSHQCLPKRLGSYLVLTPSQQKPGGVSFLSDGDIEAMRRSIELTFDGPQSFNYGDDLVRPLVTANCAMIGRLLGGLLETPDVTVIPNVPIGGCMIPYDFCFETDPSHSRVSYPDYNQLTDEHRDHFFALPALHPHGHRRHFHYILKTLTVPSHECIHVYQGVAKQRDPSGAGWSAEHDASVPAMSLMFTVAEYAMHKKLPGHTRDETEQLLGGLPAEEEEQGPLWREVASIYADGVLEAAMIDWLRELHDIHELLTPEEMGEMLKMKDAFGTYQPKITTPIVATGFKSLLPYEYFTARGAGVKVLLDAIFKGRVGATTSDPETKPDLCESASRPDEWMFQRPPPVESILPALEQFEDAL